MLHGEAIHRFIQGRRRPDESQDSLDDSELSLGWQESNHPIRRTLGDTSEATGHAIWPLGMKTGAQVKLRAF